MDTLKTEFLCELSADLEAPQQIGTTPRGTRHIIYVKGGAFEGPKLKGMVLPGGGDWLLVRPDDASELDVRGTLQTDDGHLIYVQYRGIIHAPPDSCSGCGRANVTSIRPGITSGQLQCSRQGQRSTDGSTGS